MQNSSLKKASENGGEEILLELKNVSRNFIVRQGFFKTSSKLLAVDRVNLQLRSGQSLGLVGESGCGKSTLGRLACGLLKPDEGKVLLLGRELPLAGSGSWAAGSIQMVFQDPASSLNPRLKVLTSVAEPLLAKGEKKNIALEKAAEVLKIIGLEGLGSRYPHQFSGGQKQRIALGRALITHPFVIVCDEPVSALDASVQAQILNLLKDVQSRYNLAYLFISHDLSVIGFMCEDILVMYLGQIVEKAPKKNIFDKPAHPYTEVLLKSMPGGENAWRKGDDLNRQPMFPPGELPSPLNPPSGCRFHPRCVKAQSICHEVAPVWQSIGKDWFVRCHFPNIPKIL